MSETKLKKDKILISACLLGVPCRWHGKKLYMSSFVKKYEVDKDIEWIRVCPEELGGLKTPRKPVKRRQGRVFETCEEKENRKNVTGPERTEEFLKGALKVLQIARDNNIEKAILCKYSPSCDKNGITGKLLNENGIFIINTF